MFSELATPSTSRLRGQQEDLRGHALDATLQREGQTGGEVHQALGVGVRISSTFIITGMFS